MRRLVLPSRLSLGRWREEADQVHLLIHYPPKHSVSAMVNSLKGVASRLLRSARPDLAHQYWEGRTLGLGTTTLGHGCRLARRAARE
ncbi:MAG: hypothetical protein DMG70_32540 [Acidobacteria bacterium]|nr:MAG: hypothetical protein DMG70_32540 [Acidobacteriota bacterium]